jgi:diguanylate cyclase (GGDEF)-like protein
MANRFKNSVNHKESDFKVFHEIGKTLTSTLDLKEVLIKIMDKINELMHPRNWSLLLVDEGRRELYFEIVVGASSESLKDMRIRFGEGIAGWVAENREPLFLPDVSGDPRFNPRIDDLLGFTTHSILCAPMISKDRVLGVIELINDGARGKFSAEDLQILSTLADYAAIAIENAKYFLKIQELTITDDVTELNNSRFLYQALDREIKRSRRYRKQFCLIFIDLDYFKNVNDKYGHLAGSHLLREFGDVLRQTLRDVDIITRYGGDEFVIILPETTPARGLKAAKRIREALNQHEFHPERNLTLKVTASFGVSVYPEDAQSALDIIRAADQAMYRVKQSTRDGVKAAGKD